MFARQKNFLRAFARVSPVFAEIVFVPLLVLCSAASLPARAWAHSEDAGTSRTSTTKREAASAQFDRAEELRDALKSKPVEKRTLAEYRQVVSSYRRVYLITPHAEEVPDALLAVAELYTEMGERFGTNYYQAAVESYEFLMSQYPASKYGQDALLRVARLQREKLAEAQEAAKSYREFLKKYPHSARKREAEEALAEIALLENEESPANGDAAAESRTSGDRKPGEKESARAGGNAKNLGKRGATAIATPGDDELDEAEATPGASSHALPAEVDPSVSNSLAGVPRLRRISTSVTSESTRVIIDLEETVQYASARIRNPDRIFFDLHAARLSAEVAKGNIHIEGGLLTAVRVAQNQAGVVRVVLDVNGVKDYNATQQEDPPRLIIDLYPESHKEAVRSAKARRNQHGGTDARSAQGRILSQDNLAADGESPTSANGRTAREGDSSAAQPAKATAVAAAGRSGSGKAPRSSSAKPDLVQPVFAAQPTHDGQSTLTRTLGLKIGRIVIDAGHGGHDTGTIGPTGLMEKDLCLDVALRLGKIIAQRLPGAEVVYTRSDDTFIPLEERTRMANEAKADLFISIHANSSHDHSTRGIETYYLNLKSSPDAMEVAARENATSEEGVHDLEDLVKKIARSEKIDESRELASDVQESLAKRMQKAARTVKDRGVRKAPFVVLIGADMPSILTEISFLSNSADELLLKKPEQRQRVAEGLYQGVASYLQSMNSMTLNGSRTPAKPLAARSAALDTVEQSRNPQ